MATDCPVALQARTTTQTRALHRACELAGGLAAFAELLEVSPSALARYMKGEERTPQRILLAAIDVLLATPPPAEPAASSPSP